MILDSGFEFGYLSIKDDKDGTFVGTFACWEASGAVIVIKEAVTQIIPAIPLFKTLARLQFNVCTGLFSLVLTGN